MMLLERWILAGINSVISSAYEILVIVLIVTHRLQLKAISFVWLFVCLIGENNVHDRKDALFPIMPRGGGVL